MDIIIEQFQISSASDEQLKSIQRILDECDYSSPFHTPLWNKIVADESGLRNSTLVARRDDTLVGFFTYFEDSELGCKMLISPAAKYYSIYGCPIAIPDHDDIIPILLKEAQKRSGASFFCLTTSPGYPFEALAKSRYLLKEALTSLIDVRRSESELLSAIQRTTRQSIKSAIKKNAVVMEGSSFDIDVFYELYSSLYKDINTMRSTPLNILSERFVRRVYSTLSASGEAFLLVGRVNREVANTSIQLCHKGTVYAWLLGTRRDLREYKVDSLLYWTLLNWAREHGYHFVDLCGIEITSMAQFKRSFGGTDTSFYHATKKNRTHKLQRALYYFSHPQSLFKRLRLT